MSIKHLAAQFTLPERHVQLTPMRVSIAGYVQFDRQLAASLKELERAHPSKTRPTGRPAQGYPAQGYPAPGRPAPGL